MEDENFKKELEDLFRLFKRLVEKESLEDLPGVDAQQLEQFKTFMAQFDDIKDDVKIEMMGKMDPFTKMMVSSIVQQLREQLGPDDDLSYEPLPSVEDIVSRKEEELKTHPDASERVRSLIDTIDEQLKNPNLTEDEIDALLDKRSELTHNS